MSKPLCDRPRAFAPPESDRDVCTERCSLVLQRHINSIKKDDDASDMHSSSDAASVANSRRRCRTLHMLNYLAAEPSGKAYAIIIENADEQIIRAIRGVGREYNQGFMGDLSPVESLALGRYRKSIGELADYANSLERTREVLLKPRKPRRHVPESVEYVPMLLTLALTKGGLEKYVDDVDESADMDDGSDRTSISALLDREEGLTDDAGQDGEDEDEEAEDDEGEDEEDNEGEDEEVEDNEGEDEEVEDNDGEDEEVEDGEDEDEEAEDGEDEDEDMEDEEVEDGEDEEAEDGEDEDEEVEDGEDEDEEGEDGEDEDEEVEDEDEEGEDAEQPAKNLKRRHAEQSCLDMWKKRNRYG